MGVELAGRAEHGAEAAGFVGHEAEQHQRHDEQKGRGKALQVADGFHAAPDHGHVQQPEAEEADPQNEGHRRRGWPQHVEHRVDGLAADPGLDAKPAAGHQRAQHCRNVCAAHAKGGAHEDGKGMPYLAPAWAFRSMGIRTMRLPSRMVTECLLPVHAARDEAGGEHVGGDPHRHGEPERDVVVGAPGALLGRGGCEVGVVERGSARSP